MLHSLSHSWFLFPVRSDRACNWGVQSAQPTLTTVYVFTIQLRLCAVIRGMIVLETLHFLMKRFPPLQRMSFPL